MQLPDVKLLPPPIDPILQVNHKYTGKLSSLEKGEKEMRSRGLWVLHSLK